MAVAPLVSRWIERLLSRHDPALTVAQYLALRAIAAGDLTGAELARRTGVTGPAVSQLLTGLADAGPDRANARGGRPAPSGAVALGRREAGLPLGRCAARPRAQRPAGRRAPARGGRPRAAAPSHRGRAGGHAPAAAPGRHRRRLGLSPVGRPARADRRARRAARPPRARRGRPRSPSRSPRPAPARTSGPGSSRRRSPARRTARRGRPCPPIAIAAAAPTARVSVATAMITNIRNAVSTSS